MNCQLCEVRRPRRFCPGVRGEICAPCCGTEREVTVSCPLDCEFLREARRHEKPPEVDPDQFPNADIRVNESFLRDNERLLSFTGAALLEAALAAPGAIDYDAREALEALVKTYRTLESGLYYESRPSNSIAAAISAGLQERVAEYRKRETQSTGVSSVRDASVLGVLVFLQRLELSNNNGRKRGRAFLDFLRGFFPGDRPQERAAGGESPLIAG
jgi:hypothetical protein